MSSKPPSGVRVGVYLVGVSDEALDRIASFSTKRVRSRAPRLAAWIEDLVTDEHARRIRSGVRGGHREPDMPALPSVEWTNTEVGEALRCIFAVRASAFDPAADRFLARVTTILVALAANRLERSDLTSRDSKEK